MTIRFLTEFMKSHFINFLLGTAMIFVGVFAVQAQMENNKTISEIKSLRQKLLTAIKERDRKTLDTIYADDFTHTHASGQVDDKQKRINALVSGEATIESAEVSEINFRAYGKTTVVAVGQSAITDAQQKTTNYRWTIVYVKSGRKWQIAASQATKIPGDV